MRAKRFGMPKKSLLCLLEGHYKLFEMFKYGLFYLEKAAAKASLDMGIEEQMQFADLFSPLSHNPLQCHCHFAWCTPAQYSYACYYKQPKNPFFHELMLLKPGFVLCQVQTLTEL